MSAECVVVLLSAASVNSNRADSVQDVFTNDDNIEIINTKKILLNEEQQKSIPMLNIQQFCSGAIQAHLLKSKQEIDFELIQKTNKLSKTDIFTTKDLFFISKLKEIIFPQKQIMKQSVLLCSPPLNDDHFTEITEELKLKGIFVLYHGELSSQNNPNINSIYNQQNDDGDNNQSNIIKCTAILCESFGVTDQLQLFIGTDNIDLCEEYSPNSWYNRYKDNNYTFNQTAENIDQFIPKLSTERTLALIKPTAVSKGYAENIINEIKENGFTIISSKKCHLRMEHAQHFYGEHKGKPFFNDLTSFMSSGPIYAFILERVGAIKCWRTLLGPTNTFTAKQKSSQSIRARYGTDQTQNAAHGSDSIASAKREIKFYFPEIGLNSHEINNKKSINIVQEYMSQKLENNETLQEFLIKGLSELAKAKPGSALQVVEWFANWLLSNNPNKPNINEPNDIDIDKLSFLDKIKYYNGGNDLKIIFILGGPGSGKGTQCKKIVENYNFIQISAGDLCRKVMNDKSSKYSQKVKEIMQNGQLVSTELLLTLLKHEMIDLKGDKYLLDGFPRSLDQAINFEKELVPSVCALNFICSDDILMERCLKRAQSGSGRVDDNKETINKRLETFHDQTDPTIEYLRSMDKVHDIDANKGVDDIWTNVKHIMDGINVVEK